jgi:hypothetical protein
MKEYNKRKYWELKNDPEKYREYLEKKREYNKKRYWELKQNSEK